jgi:hypothetical protein
MTVVISWMTDAAPNGAWNVLYVRGFYRDVAPTELLQAAVT